MQCWLLYILLPIFSCKNLFQQQYNKNAFWKHRQQYIKNTPPVAIGHVYSFIRDLLNKVTTKPLYSSLTAHYEHLCNQEQLWHNISYFTKLLFLHVVQSMMLFRKEHRYCIVDLSDKLNCRLPTRTYHTVNAEYWWFYCVKIPNGMLRYIYICKLSSWFIQISPLFFTAIDVWFKYLH